MADEQALTATLEQSILENRRCLAALEVEQQQVIAKQRWAASQAKRCQSGIVWAETKQRYRHKLDQQGLRLVLLICGPFAAVLLPFSFMVAVLGDIPLGIVAGIGSGVASVLSYKLTLCGSDAQTNRRIYEYRELRSAALASAPERVAALEAVQVAILGIQTKLVPLEKQLAECRRQEDERRKENAFDTVATRLYNARWRELRGVDFETFIAQVFQNLGYAVEGTPVSGDQGVDLIVIAGELRIAVQVKGYYNSVSNSAIQEVVAGMRFHSCVATCVVTNSRFTKSALELAASNDCLCIEEANFEDFVFGRLVRNT